MHEYTTDASQFCPYINITAAIAFSIREDPRLRKKIGDKILSLRGHLNNISTWITEQEIFFNYTNAVRLVLHCLS